MSYAWSPCVLGATVETTYHAVAVAFYTFASIPMLNRIR